MPAKNQKEKFFLVTSRMYGGLFEQDLYAFKTLDEVSESGYGDNEDYWVYEVEVVRKGRMEATTTYSFKEEK